MRKLFLVSFAFLALASANAQNFKAGGSLGLPVGDASDFYTFNLTLDLGYLWDVSDKFQAGIVTGISYNFGDSLEFVGESFDIENAIFIPIAAAGRLAITEKFKFGADIGYSLGIEPEGNDGGFYWSPRAQYGVSAATDIVFAYRSISLDGSSFNTLTLGVELGF